MILGRILGWGLIGLAVLLASGDAVLALGPGDHSGLMAQDMWMLVTGKLPWAQGQMAAVTAMLLSLPAWTLLGPAGAVLLVISRPRKRRRRSRH